MNRAMSRKQKLQKELEEKKKQEEDERKMKEKEEKKFRELKIVKTHEIMRQIRSANYANFATL